MDLDKFAVVDGVAGSVREEIPRAALAQVAARLPDLANIQSGYATYHVEPHT